jgi:TetR/AcrR family transcriptional repressor of nem operon
MKVSREQAVENRERIIDAAAKLYREHGFDGIGVADLMKQAGMTHGGFYGHFASKEDLIAQACVRATGATLERWSEEIRKTGEDPFVGIQRRYLSPRHRDNPGAGCLIAAVGSDICRQGPTVRQAVTRSLAATIERFASIAPGRSKAAKREKAMRTFATMVGAMVLARSVDDPKFANEILQAALPSQTSEA